MKTTIKTKLDQHVKNLLHTLSIEPKIKLNTTIITAGDKRYFVALQTLIASIRLSHIADIIVFNLGLTKKQIEWIRSQNVIVITTRNLQIPKTVHFWQTWNKPCYFIQASKYVNNKSFLWIDADCIVTGSLKWIDKNLIESGPVVFADTAAALCNGGIKNAVPVVSNISEMYEVEKYKVSQRCEIDSYPNAGVIGLNLCRELDSNILYYWNWMVSEANKNPNLLDKKQVNWEDQKWLKWYDQGALQWAIEKCNATHKIINDSRFNNAVYGSHVRNYEDVIRALETVKREGSIKIIHFLAGRKPYSTFPKNFNPDYRKYKRQEKPLNIFVLGYKKQLTIKDKYLKYIHLPDIDKNNDLAESRIFQSNIINNCKSQYIGLATDRWDEKYKDECLQLKDLYKLPLSPDIVWCGRKSDIDWFKYTVKIHPGMEVYLNYLIKELNIKNIYREVPWSNNFIAHKSVLNDLQSWHWICWGRLRTKFGNNIKYGMKGSDKLRIGSYLAERISMLFFCMRDDLTYSQIPL